MVRVVDQGKEFYPGKVVDPLAQKNLFKPSGWGVFFVRSFMDDLTLQPGPEGGTEVRMAESLPPWLPDVG